MKQLKSIFFIFLFLFSVCNAQTDSSKTRAEDDKYTPAGTDLFSIAKTNGKNGSRASEGLSFAVKAVPFDLMRGNFLIQTETKIQDNMSIIFGIGYNVMNDFVLTNFNESLFGSSPTTYLGMSDLISQATYVKGGVVVQLGFREYMKKLRLNSNRYTYFHDKDNDGRPLNDWYKDIGFKFSKATYEIDTMYTFKGKKVKGGNTLETRSFYLLSGFGYSFATNGKMKMVHDIYFNLGIRLISYTKYLLSYDYNINTQQTIEFYQKNTARSISLFAPTLHIGYSFGFGI